MRSRNTLLFVLFSVVSLAGFVAGWLFREGPSARAFAVLALTVGAALVAGAIVSVRAREDA
jgi:hypothetical protein